jgi:trans-aconitate 2-methyltransferase
VDDAPVSRPEPRDWDGATYDQIADPQARWGADVLDRLRLAGDETVLDAGCGSGRVTERLTELLPRGHVVALDASTSMIEVARARLAGFGDRIDYVVADLAQALPLPAASVDAILSTATFHWVADHDALFRNLAAVLRPGGRLTSQWGGAGNIRAVLAAIRATGESWPGPWTFATPDETRRRLEAAGFRDVEAWLQDEPTPIEPGTLRAFLRTAILGAHLDRLPADERDPFVDAVAARLPDGVIDYVRLNVLATRA